MSHLSFNSLHCAFISSRYKRRGKRGAGEGSIAAAGTGSWDIDTRGGEIRFNFVENTGIAAAGEAGIGGKAGIVGTDRDGGAGGGRDGECGVGSGGEEAGL